MSLEALVRELNEAARDPEALLQVWERVRGRLESEEIDVVADALLRCGDNEQTLITALQTSVSANGAHFAGSVGCPPLPSPCA